MGLRTMIPENFFREKRILITGGLGFIGSNLARRLVGLGARLTLVDSLIPEYGGNLFNIRGLENAVRVIAGLRASPEGQEGLGAFLEKRPPSWKP